MDWNLICVRVGSTFGNNKLNRQWKIHISIVLTPDNKCFAQFDSLPVAELSSEYNSVAMRCAEQQLRSSQDKPLNEINSTYVRMMAQDVWPCTASHHHQATTHPLAHTRRSLNTKIERVLVGCIMDRVLHVRRMMEGRGVWKREREEEWTEEIRIRKVHNVLAMLVVQSKDNDNWVARVHFFFFSSYSGAPFI